MELKPRVIAIERDFRTTFARDFLTNWLIVGIQIKSIENTTKEIDFMQALT